MGLNGVPDSTSFTHRFGPGQYTTSFIEPLRGLKVDFVGRHHRRLSSWRWCSRSRASCCQRLYCSARLRATSAELQQTCDLRFHTVAGLRKLSTRCIYCNASIASSFESRTSSTMTGGVPTETFC